MPKKAFTLVELLIVIIIIGILATMAIPQYNKIVEKSKWTEVVSIVNQINKATEIYYLERGFYPNKASEAPGGHIYLNGPNKATNSGILIDVPDYPGSTKFIYALLKGSYFENGGQDMYVGHKYGSFAFKDATGDGIHGGSEEPYIYILEDGTIYSGYGAPQY